MNMVSCSAYIATSSMHNSHINKSNFAAIYAFDNVESQVISIQGSLKNSSIALIELEGLLQVLECMPLEKRYYTLLTIQVSSSFIYNAFKKGWLNTWEKNRWHKANGTPVAYAMVWKKILELARHYQYIQVDSCDKDDKYYILANNIVKNNIKNDNYKIIKNKINVA